MKKYLIAIVLMALALSACHQSEDLVEGSIPPERGPDNIVPTNLGQVVIYFKGTVDSDSLSLDQDHTWVEVYDGDTLDILAGDVAFQDGATYPRLLKSIMADDTLVLFFNEGFLEAGKKYRLYLDNYHLLAGCSVTRTRPFNVTFLTSDTIDEYGSYDDSQEDPPYAYDPADDPPYIIITSPPDESDFPDAPPFPPHGDIMLYFSEPVPYGNIAVSEAQPVVGDTLFSIIPSDLELWDGESWQPFDATKHKILSAQTALAGC